MDSFTGRRDITKTLLKNGINPFPNDKNTDITKQKEIADWQS